MKYRLLLPIITCLIAMFLGSKLSSQSCNCLPGWQYKTFITVTNNNPSLYINFEVRITVNTQALISASKMKADGSDIRFEDSVCSPLSYFLESGINTSNTIVWVKVPVLAPNSTKIIFMYYGNAGALTESSGPNTFAFFEGFDNNNLGHFGTGPVCSSGTPNVSFSGGLATFSWNLSAMWLADLTFPLTDVYTGEAQVTAASGNFPGVYWARSIGTQSMSVMMGGGFARVSKTPISGITNCDGQNFVMPNFPISNPVGIWGFTWISQGSQLASFPVIGMWNTADVELPKDQPLRLGIGGVASGAGSYTIDWVRARKYAPLTPLAIVGPELSAPAGPGNSCVATVLSSSSIRVNWTDNALSEEKYRIERSTDNGTNWLLKDSVGVDVTNYIDTGLAPVTQYCYRVYAVNCFGSSPYSNASCSTTPPIGIIKEGSEIPLVYNLFQNYPNPFNPETNIKFDIPFSSDVKLMVFDILGRQIAVLVDEHLSAGSYKVDWRAENYSSGVYFYRIEARKTGSFANDYNKYMKMVLVK